MDRYTCKHFKIYELVDPATYRRFGERAWMFFDDDTLRMLDRLRKNALNAGYEEADIEVKWVSDEELQPLMAALNQPTPEEIAAKETEALIQAKMREMAEAELIAEGKLVAEVK